MELSAEHQQKRRPSDSNTDYMTHKDNGKESDPQAGHKMADIQATQDRHAGHSVAMFRDKFWLSFALRLGSAAGGYYSVLEGLKVNDEVVTDGNFILKAEAVRQHPESH